MFSTCTMSGKLSDRPRAFMTTINLHTSIPLDSTHAQGPRSRRDPPTDDPGPLNREVSGTLGQAQSSACDHQSAATGRPRHMSWRMRHSETEVWINFSFFQGIWEVSYLNTPPNGFLHVSSKRLFRMMRRRWSLEETKWPRLVLYQQSKPKHVETRVQAVRVQVKAKKTYFKRAVGRATRFAQTVKQPHLT